MLKNAFFTLFILIAACVPAQADERIFISFGHDRAGYPDTEIFQDILREAYRRIGLEVAFGHRSLPRDLEDACEHHTDASAFRTQRAVENKNNLIRVPVVLARSSFAGFTTHPNITIQSWADLKHLRVAYINGVRIVAIRAKEAMIPLIKAKNFIHGFRLLESDRIDVLIAEDLFGMEVFNEHFEGTINVSKPLFSEDIFHYVNREHADLVPGLTTAFRSMFDDGTMRRLFGKYQSMLPETAE